MIPSLASFLIIAAYLCCVHCILLHLITDNESNSSSPILTIDSEHSSEQVFLQVVTYCRLINASASLACYNKYFLKAEEEILSLHPPLFLHDITNPWFYIRSAQANSIGLHERLKVYVGIGSYGLNLVTFNWWGEKNAGLSVGNYCQFAGSIRIMLGGNHRYKRVTTYPFDVLRRSSFDSNLLDSLEPNPYTNGPIVVGHDVWIAEDVTILSNVSVGDGAILGAGAFVRRDVPPYAIVTGNPAVVVGYRHSPDQITKLLKIKWWEWDEERVTKALPLLVNEDVNVFIDHYYPLVDSTHIIRGGEGENLITVAVLEGRGL